MPKADQAIAEAVRDSDRSFAVFAANKLDDLIKALSRRGYQVMAPRLRDAAIVVGPIESSDQLPRGWTDMQAPARYRVQRRQDEAFFSYSVGAQSWKKYLHPSELLLWSAERQNGSFRILNHPPVPERPFAFVGVRACDLRAIAIEDRVLVGDKFKDPVYGCRRAGIFIVAVQCAQSAPTCFCASLGTGPRVSSGYDLCLTELLDSGPHRFMVETGTDRGAEVLAEIETTPGSDDDLALQEQVVEKAGSQQTRKIDAGHVKQLLERNFDHAHWDDVAARCLSCANCTMVCPTCFCTTVEDVTDVSGTQAERWRRWDSCFTLSFSYIHGGSIRSSGKARYRQWITHKLAAWRDQFGTSGCVGCGRCITWCPAGIDITAEVHAFEEG